MDIREAYRNQIDRALCEDEPYGQENVKLQQVLYKLVKEEGSYSVLTELINVLTREEPEIAVILKKALGPLPEDS